MTNIQIFGFAPSTYVRTARMICVELGIDHELTPLAFKEPSHLELHPFGKMPVMRHGDVTLFETLAIAAYLTTAFGGSLVPKDRLENALMMQWISAANDAIYGPVVGLTHEDEPSAAALEDATARLGVLDRALADREHLASEALTLADLFAYPMVDHTARKLRDVVEPHKNLTRWRATIANRNSAKKTAP